MVKSLRELEKIRDDCRALVTRRAGLSAGAAVVPVPGIDMGVDVTILIRLLPQINRKFGLTPEQIAELDPETKKIVLVVASAIGSEIIGRVITKQLLFKLLEKIGIRLATRSFVRYVPFVGQLIGASISFGAMKMLGNAHIDDCFEVARRALLKDASSSAEDAELVPAR